MRANSRQENSGLLFLRARLPPPGGPALLGASGWAETRLPLAACRAGLGVRAAGSPQTPAWPGISLGLLQHTAPVCTRTHAHSHQRSQHAYHTRACTTHTPHTGMCHPGRTCSHICAHSHQHSHTTCMRTPHPHHTQACATPTPYVHTYMHTLTQVHTCTQTSHTGMYHPCYTCTHICAYLHNCTHTPHRHAPTTPCAPCAYICAHAHNALPTLMCAPHAHTGTHHPHCTRTHTCTHTNAHSTCTTHAHAPHTHHTWMHTRAHSTHQEHPRLPRRTHQTRSSHRVFTKLLQVPQLWQGGYVGRVEGVAGRRRGRKWGRRDEWGWTQTWALPPSLPKEKTRPWEGRCSPSPPPPGTGSSHTQSARGEPAQPHRDLLCNLRHVAFPLWACISVCAETK